MPLIARYEGKHASPGHYESLALAMFSLSAAHTQATDYNDPWWASPNANTSFVDQFDGVSIDRSKWLVEQNIFVNGEDIDYQDVEYPAADWTFRVGQPDTGAFKFILPVKTLEHTKQLIVRMRIKFEKRTIFDNLLPIFTLIKKEFFFSCWGRPLWLFRGVKSRKDMFRHKY